MKYVQHNICVSSGRCRILLLVIVGSLGLETNLPINICGLVDAM